MRNRIISFLLLIAVCIGMLNLNVPQISAASTMKMSNDGIEYLKKMEGFSKYPYYDYGQYTVGYGTKCPGNMYDHYKKNGITDEEATALLAEHLAYAESYINSKLIDKYGLTLTQSQFDALVSLSFNVGTSWITTNKVNILKSAIVNGGDAEEITYAFSLYCKAGGEVLAPLVKRRLCEANMYLNGVYSDKRDDSFAYVLYNPNGGEMSYQVQGYIVSTNTAPVKDVEYDGHVFMGWYTDIIGGTQVSTLTKALDGQILYAHWDTIDGAGVDNIDPIEVVVTADWVNIRKGPGTNYDKNGQVNKGDVLTITHIVDGSNLKWGKFSNGWICLDYTNYEDLINGVDDDLDEEQADNQENQQLGDQHEQQKKTYGTVVVKDSLRIRKGPGTSYETVGFLKNNDRVEILETQRVDGDAWARIGENKWASLAYIVVEEVKDTDSSVDTETDDGESELPDTTEPPTEQTTPESTEPEIPEKTEPEDAEKEPTSPSDGENENKENENTSTESTIGVVKVEDSLRIRSGPGTQHAIVGYLFNGQRVNILDRCVVANVEWGKVGKEKWICMSYVVLETNDSKADTDNSTDSSQNSGTNESASDVTNNVEKMIGTITADSLRIRKDAGTSHDVVGHVYKGTVVEILEKKDVAGSMWGKITNGWISLSYVSFDDSTSSDGEDDIKTVTADCLRIRKNAGSTHDTVGYLYKGMRVQILEVKNVNGEPWGRIDKGWICLRYTK